MDQWQILLHVLSLLLAALVLGAVCERLRQSAILGYLLAGTLLGPHALGLITDVHEVELLAELGVAMLLFSIGLEFSWRRLKQMGTIALLGGTLQVVVTAAVAAGVTLGLGQSIKVAVVIGAIVALSSTACVLRLLTSRAEIDSLHGRSVLGILLLQDIAVVPLVLLVTALGGEGTAGQIAMSLGRALLVALLMVGAFYVLFNTIVPRALQLQTMRGNRELPTLLAIVTGLGSTWIAHALGLSPAIGAFIAGMLLAESPFASQIRADVSSLRTVLMTLFFASVGMFGDPVWIAGHLGQVAALVAAIVIGKALIIWALLRRFGLTHRSALAAGVCLGQVGEFSFVLMSMAHATGLLVNDLFLLLVSATIITLFLTPPLVARAAAIGSAIADKLAVWKWITVIPLQPEKREDLVEGHIVLIGFGPAGQAVGHTLVRQDRPVTIVDLNPRAIGVARQLGFYGQIGDVTHSDVLEHAHVATAGFVVITIPDPGAVRRVIELVRAMAPNAQIVVRARYHVYRWELQIAGAHIVVDEEEEVGHRIANELRKAMRKASPPSVMEQPPHAID
jgi:CPA2 family monovalent cation:H+ antiporter-2